MGADQEERAAKWDGANDGMGGVNQVVTGANGARQVWNNLAATDENGLPAGAFTRNDALRPFGLSYDPPEPSEVPHLGESAMPGPQLAPEEEDAWFAGKSNPAAVEIGEESDALLAETQHAAFADNMFNGAAGLLGLVGGGFQFKSGWDRATKEGAREQDKFDGGLDMVGGVAGIGGGALGLTTAGAFGATAATALAPAAAVAAPLAAAVGLGVAGDHRAEEMHMFGKDKDGNYQGAVEAAWNESMHLGDAASHALGGGALGKVGGAAVAGLSTVGLEAGAAVTDVGLGIESLGASSGMFGTAKNVDGKGTHNRGAFEALDDLGSFAGDKADDLFHLDHNSVTGEVVGGIAHALTDVTGAGAAVAAEALGGVVGGAKALGKWAGPWIGHLLHGDG